MSGLPELNKTASDAKEQVENHARNLLPWLPDPYTCGNCNVLCGADVVYDYRMFEYTDAWTCPECESSYYREEPWHE